MCEGGEEHAHWPTSSGVCVCVCVCVHLLGGGWGGRRAGKGGKRPGGGCVCVGAYLHRLLGILGDLGVGRERLLHDARDVGDGEEAVLLPDIRLGGVVHLFSGGGGEVNLNYLNLLTRYKYIKARPYI